MGMQWTKEQQQVIELRDRNILVSAAAGSGKTAVLVERILNKLTQKDHPVDIDRLLIVTFTRAAAGEMKERLAAAIEKRLTAEPDNEHLQRQQTLIYNAQINTIDGFCSYVIRNYFHTIDLDPGFRTADEGELKLLKQDVAEELLEKNYDEGTPEFNRFTECFASGKSDDGLIDLILRLYETAMSNPWPREWLADIRKEYLVEDGAGWEESRWMELLWEDADRTVSTLAEELADIRKMILAADGPYMYEDAWNQDDSFRKQMEAAVKERDFDRCVELLGAVKFAVLSRKKDTAVSAAKREQVKQRRDGLKAAWKELKERYFYHPEAVIREEMELCRIPVLELVRLTEDFMDAFAEKKRKKNLVDFTDMEHFALDILVKKEEGRLVYTEAADEFSSRFEEIMVDEYQDSNLVQETLLGSVSKLRFGIHNIFMVGDVKQSIYRFRLARPELFMEKYDTYSEEESDCQKIDLHKNFRSRWQVLAGVNFIFRQIMGRDLGSVEYDDAAALYPGAIFPPCTHRMETEVLVLETDGIEEKGGKSAEQTDQELEARMIGRRIQEMAGRQLVLDKATQTYRQASYGDCVILLRTMAGWSETFARVLSSMGIPVYATSKTGYFSTREVETLLNYLRILDNPMQEIPFTGVLLSPMAGCTAAELASMKAARPKEKIYACAWEYGETGEDLPLRKKLQSFLKVYEEMRRMVPYTPIHELIERILQTTGYDTCAAAMPGGTQRRANLQMLVEMAMEYEKTSYRGLFNFIRYIEQLQKYQVDYGEVSIVGENEDTVRIMSIHKSKGLEFPIVFVAGMGKRFNMMDASASLVIHPDLGIGVNGVDPERRLRIPTLLRQVIQKQIRLENLGEELRVLYVALTRAKEKLILTGTVDHLDKRLDGLRGLVWQDEKQLSYAVREKARSYWDWILPSLARHPAMKELFIRLDGYEGRTDYPPAAEVPLQVRLWLPRELVEEEAGRQIGGELRYREYRNWDTTKIYEKSLHETLEENFSYTYEYAYLQEIPAKISVSELKRGALQPEEDASLLYPEEPVVPLIPAFMRQEEETVKGAMRGTAYHSVLEKLDYGKVNSVEEIEAQVAQMVESGRLEPEMAASVRCSQIHWFANSYLGQRMAKAASRGQLWREQQFVMSIPANRKNPDWKGNEEILVQGIIDAFFAEGDGLVLVDYKTDYVTAGGEAELVSRYAAQIQYYKEALEKIRCKKVKAAYIYSFFLGKAINII